MACIPWREWIVGRRHGFGIADLPVAPVDDRLAPTRSPWILLGGPSGGFLGAMGRGGALSGLRDRPLLGASRDDVARVAVRHGDPPSEARIRSLSAGQHARAGHLKFTTGVCRTAN